MLRAAIRPSSSARRVLVSMMALSSSSSSAAGKALTVATMNQRIVQAEYAVRGELATRAEKYKKELASGSSSLPFKEVVHCNIGNPQQLQQKPITFFRQVFSLLDNPDLLKTEVRDIVARLYPEDAIARASAMLAQIGSTGAYSHSMGIPFIRANVAKFIEERDGFPSDPEHIFLSAGASDAVKAVLDTIISDDNVGIMIPIPQYPLYTASLTLFGGHGVPYFLKEKEDWGLSVDEMEASLKEARAKGLSVRAMVVINPGNPTGQTLSIDNMKDIVRFCRREGLVLLADEVYQSNVYQSSRPFHSFKKVSRSMGSEGDVELFSFHSVSKGMVGECGRRGGYVECANIDQGVLEQFYKLGSISLCPTVQGQMTVDLMVRPPAKGDASYESYKAEVDAIFQSLGRRAKRLAEALNKLEGVTCNDPMGAMYVFPQIRLPARAVEAAKEAKQQPDVFYSLALLDATGVCVVPGSGFGQEAGTYHFRATFLPPEAKFDDFLAGIAKFHADFMKRYQ